MTAGKTILSELEKLFAVLSGKVKSVAYKKKFFNQLLVAGFNLKNRFIELIDREIANAISGLPAGITIKLNNLQERDLIFRLYDASQAGVKVSLIVRSICCIIPGVTGMSENIRVTRIVDRYLEHSRVFMFNNNNDPEIFLGSADWMNRNIYNRIEVCFPVYDKDIAKQLINIFAIQLADNSQAVMINEKLENIIKDAGPNIIQSQHDIYQLLSADNQDTKQFNA
jgi:polyphosphate kinase